MVVRPASARRGGRGADACTGSGAASAAVRGRGDPPRPGVLPPSPGRGRTLLPASPRTSSDRLPEVRSRDDRTDTGVASSPRTATPARQVDASRRRLHRATQPTVSEARRHLVAGFVACLSHAHGPSTAAHRGNFHPADERDAFGGRGIGGKRARGPVLDPNAARQGSFCPAIPAHHEELGRAIRSSVTRIDLAECASGGA